MSSPTGPTLSTSPPMPTTSRVCPPRSLEQTIPIWVIADVLDSLTFLNGLLTTAQAFCWVANGIQYKTQSQMKRGKADTICKTFNMILVIQQCLQQIIMREKLKGLQFLNRKIIGLCGVTFWPLLCFRITWRKKQEFKSVECYLFCDLFLFFNWLRIYLV